MEQITHSAEETEALGETLGRSLKAGDIVALFGTLGAGKTAFTRGIARGLGISEPVTSPTFAIVNEYPGSPELCHFDLYRLEDERELYDIGWEDYLSRKAVLVMEWSERLHSLLPPEAIRVEIETMSENDRRITWKRGGMTP